MKISKKLTALAALTAATTAFAAPLTIGDLCKIPQNPLNSHQDI